MRSTTTLVPPVNSAVPVVVVPVTVITSVGVTSGARPEAENTGSEVRLPGAAELPVSTRAGTPPSMDTVAMPTATSRSALSDVSITSSMTSLPWKLRDIAARALPRGGSRQGRTSNASMTMRLLNAAGFVRPVTTIVKVWVPLASPEAVNMVC